MLIKESLWSTTTTLTVGTGLRRGIIEPETITEKEGTVARSVSRHCQDSGPSRHVEDLTIVVRRRFEDGRSTGHTVSHHVSDDSEPGDAIWVPSAVVASPILAAHQSCECVRGRLPVF